MFPKLCLFRYFQLVVAAAARHPVMSPVLHAVGYIVTSRKLLSIEVADVLLMVSIPQFGDLFYLLFLPVFLLCKQHPETICNSF